MTIRRLTQMSIAMPVIACTVLLSALAAPAAAQSEACFHLQVGSSFDAGLAISIPDNPDFLATDVATAGQTKCVSLDAVPDGTLVGVRMYVPLPHSPQGVAFLDCTPPSFQRSAALQVAITYNGNTSGHDDNCTAPSSRRR